MTLDEPMTLAKTKTLDEPMTLAQPMTLDGTMPPSDDDYDEYFSKALCA